MLYFQGIAIILFGEKSCWLLDLYIGNSSHIHTNPEWLLPRKVPKPFLFSPGVNTDQVSMKPKYREALCKTLKSITFCGKYQLNTL